MVTLDQEQKEEFLMRFSMKREVTLFQSIQSVKRSKQR